MDPDFLAVLDAYQERAQEEPTKGREPRRRDKQNTTKGRHVAAATLETARFIHILAASLHAPHILELGTSDGYATLWLAQAARAARGRVTTMELHDDKSAYAREMASRAGLASYVDFQVGNAVTLIEDMSIKPDFVFIDLWKDLYVPCLDAFYPKLNPGAIIVADNMIRPGGENALRYIRAARAKPGMTSLSVPVGAGLEISRYR
ncbi:O-methyltransferase [Paraburkholderia phytofirmans]|uniref:Class I SAM-dependent methyltransferase n=1 Tax=Paraburkholderia phytofirmans TaxID=261302 RepID=A0ABW9B8K0_9BURK